MAENIKLEFYLRVLALTPETPSIYAIINIALQNHNHLISGYMFLKSV